MAYLVLVRHGQSEWNLLGQWTGLTDVALTEEGRAEARRAAKILADINLHRAYTSKLKRAQHTLDEIIKKQQTAVEQSAHAELNERDYGDLTGKNKWQIKEAYGEEKFRQIRRSWSYPVPGGETLQAVSERVLPFYERQVLQDLRQGKNVIVSAHGNSLRALIKHLENVPDDKAHEVEIATGEVWIYEIDDSGHVLKKEIRVANPKKL